MKLRIAVLGAAMFLVAASVGCGSKGGTLGGNPTPQAKTSFHVFNAIPGGALYRPSPMAMTASFIESTPQATTTTPNIVMSFNGFCNTLPNPSDFTFGANGFGVAVYGMGRLDSSACQYSFQSYNIGTNSIDTTIGVPVVGDGTLQILRAYVATPGSTATSVKVRIFVNGASTTLACAVGTATKCADDTDTVAVKDGDLVSAIVEMQPGDNVTQLRIMLGKQ
jgi:hypothetical protein